MSVDRRDFLKKAAAAAAAAGAGPLLIGALGGEAEAATKPTVVIVRGTDPARMLKAALAYFPAVEKKCKGKRVLLKPNMSFRTPAKWGNNTNPTVAVAVAQEIKGFGARQITAIDHVLGGPSSMRVNGVQPALSKISGVQVISSDKQSGYVERAIKRGKGLTKTAICKELAAADVLINIPVAKQHMSAQISFGLKNQMGLIWDRRIFHRLDLHQSIAELATLIRADLTVIDATRVMTTGGPMGPGRVEHPKALVVGTDPVATDAVALRLAKWKGKRLSPADVKHLAHAAKLGVGVLDLGKIRVIEKRV